MVSKKDKDAESGLQVISILSIMWTLGFIYLTRNGDFLGIELAQFSIACCNIVNILFTVIFFSSWRYTVKENKVKNYLNEHFISNESVSVKFLMDKFRITPSAASKALSVWIIEEDIKGDYDHITGIFKKEPVEIDSSKVVDLEFHEITNEPDELLRFCPECGGEISISIGQPNYCPECQKNI